MGVGPVCGEGVAHPLKSVDPLWDGMLVGPVGGWLSRLTLGNGGTRTAPATGFEKRGQRFDHSRLNKTQSGGGGGGQGGQVSVASHSLQVPRELNWSRGTEMASKP